jgi:hypothetical protein
MSSPLAPGFGLCWSLSSEYYDDHISTANHEKAVTSFDVNIHIVHLSRLRHHGRTFRSRYLAHVTYSVALLAPSAKRKDL